MARKKVWDVFWDGPKPPSPKSRKSRNNPQPAPIITAAPTQDNPPKSENAGHDLNVPPFRLLSLPPELWSYILSLCLIKPDTIVLTVSERPHHPPQTLTHHQPPLTRVSRLLRTEGLRIFYGKNDFVVYEPTYCTTKWIDSLSVANVDLMGMFMYRTFVRSSFVMRKCQFKRLDVEAVVCWEEDGGVNGDWNCSRTSGARDVLGDDEVLLLRDLLFAMDCVYGKGDDNPTRTWENYGNMSDSA
ncbi:hypothetical protein LTR22_000548 [Elasticomyces elasticus]|nr:hypothetical protein LTR22_000548 [Elasticomyces elasticus]KAK4932013.1 hypothetical protein LTR49_001700 [Elasticomyces elasticus]